MDVFKNGVSALKRRHFDFILKELGISKDDLMSFDDDELNEKVYEPMCEIEISEIPINDDDPETERCRLSSEIVTLLGNSLAEAYGFSGEEES